MRTYELLGGEKPVKRELDQFESEEKLEHLLDEIPPLLLDEPILLIGRQVTVETGTLDLLGLDKFGNVVVFELKKGKSGSGSASEGSILSQPQEYAQALQWFSYEDLEDIYVEYGTEAKTRNEGTSSISDDEPLVTSFDAHFGRSLKPEKFNQRQRMVIVAEEITDRTAANARYLRDEGLNIQCVEVQRFRLAADAETSPILVASTPVDYDQRRIQPSDDSAPTYPAVNEDVVGKAFSKIKEVTNATSPAALYPSGFDHREPRLRSLHPEHPDPVRYALRVKPLEKGHVRVSIDVTTRGLEINEVDKEKLAEQVRTGETQFENAGFEVNSQRNTFRVVADEWEAETIADVRDDQLIDEVAERYAELVNIGHRTLIESV